jgi:hypothetical protein
MRILGNRWPLPGRGRWPLALALAALALLAACSGTPSPTVPAAASPTGAPVEAVAATATVPAPAPSATPMPLPTMPAEPTIAPATATGVAPTVPPASATPGVEATQASAATGPAAAAGHILVDHHSVALFEQIPPEYLAAARELRMMFADRSVGKNIDEGLDCLVAASWADAPAYCRRDFTSMAGSTWEWTTFTASDLAAGTVPERIRFTPNPAAYNRSNWVFEVHEGNGWQELIKTFSQDLVPRHADKAVLGFQFTYLNVNTGTGIASLDSGFLVDLPSAGGNGGQERWDISDMLALEAAHPDKVFVYWTSSLARGIGTAESDAFNDQLRAFAAANGKPLFDVAGILSHDADGNACYDNRDGVEFCAANGCENFADDGQNYLAICPDYTTELEGGHLGTVSGAKIRIAKAFWVLMAQIAGWEPAP